MNLFKQKSIIILLSISLLLNIALWFVLIFLLKSQGEFPLILHYNVFHGADILGRHHELFSLPITGLIILGINTSLVFYAFKYKKDLLVYTLLSTALLSQVLLLIAGSALAVING